MKSSVKYILAALWLIFVFTDYLFHHSYFTQGIANFSYWIPLTISTVLFSVFVFWKSSFSNPLKSIEINRLQGWEGYLLFWIFTFLFLGTFVQKAFPNVNVGTALGTFAGKSVMLQLGLIFVVAASFAMGQLILRPVQQLYNSASFKLISIAMGFSIIGLIAFLQGLIFPLNRYFLLALMIGVSAWQWRAVLDLLKSAFTSSLSLKNIRFYQLLPILVVLLFLSASWIDAVKLVPTGYDGLNLYGNLARNIGLSGDLPTGIQPYNWSIIMSLGWVLFDSASMGYLLSFLPGWLALAVTYRLARLYLPVTKSWMVVAFLITIPMFVFHLGSTEKIDLGFLFVQLSILLLILEAWRLHEKKLAAKEFKVFPNFLPIGKSTFKTEHLLLAAAGWLSGYAFGIKLTAFFFIASFLTLLIYKKGNRLSYIASAFVGLGILFLFNIQTLANAPIGSLPLQLLAAAYLIGGSVFFYLAFKRNDFLGLMKESRAPENVKSFAWSIGIYTIFTLLSFSPWLVRNVATADSISVETIISGESEAPKIQIDPQLLPPDKRQLTQTGGGGISAAQLLAGLVFQPTSVREELQRYMGYTEGFVNYLSVFYKQTMNTEIKGKIYVNIGLIFFLFLPFYLFFFDSERFPKYNLIRRITSGLLLLLVVSLAVYVAWSDEGDLTKAMAAQVAKQPVGFQWLFSGIHVPLTMLLYNIGSVFSGIPVLFGETYMILIVLFGAVIATIWFLLTMPVAGHFVRSYRAIGGFLLMYVLLWVWLGNGVPWYGFAGLPLLLIMAVSLFQKREEIGWRYYFNAGAFLFLLLSVFNRFSNIEKQQIKNGDIIFSFSSTAFSTGQVSDEKQILGNLDKAFYDGAAVLNADKNAKIYRVGSFIHYYIENNQKRVFEDNQLGQFESIAALLNNQNDFVKVLKDNGFKYILFNPNDLYFDQTPEQSFRKKFERFWQVLGQSRLTKVVSTNNIVADPNGNLQFQQANGQPGRGRYGIKGKVVQYGTLAVIEII